MKTNVKGKVQSDLYTGRFKSHLLKENPIESIRKEQETEDWWDRRAGGWTPDKITV
jgi:hypothetical protein